MPETYHRGRKPFWRIGTGVVVAAGLAWACLRWKPSRVAIEGGSMAPTLLPGDWALTVPLRHPKVGDVVVVEHPGRPGYEMVKRIAGGAGRPCRRSHARRRRVVGRGRSRGRLDGQSPVRPGARRRVEGQGRAGLLATRAPPARVAALRGTRPILDGLPRIRRSAFVGFLLIVLGAAGCQGGAAPNLRRSRVEHDHTLRRTAPRRRCRRGRRRGRRGRGRRRRGPHRSRRRRRRARARWCGSPRSAGAARSCSAARTIGSPRRPPTHRPRTCTS